MVQKEIRVYSGYEDVSSKEGLVFDPNTGSLVRVKPDGSRAQAGGSQPGVLTVADLLFTEVAVKTSYVASLPILAGTVIADIVVTNLAAWAASTAHLSVTDTIHSPDAYYHVMDVIGGLAVYDPTAPKPFGSGAGSNFNVITDDGNWYTGGLYSLGANAAAQNAGSAGPGVRYAAPDTISATMTTTGPSGSPTGVTLVQVVYFTPVAAINAVAS